MMCHEVNYMMLAQDNKVPEYFLSLDGVEFDYDELTNVCKVAQPLSFHSFDCDCRNCDNVTAGEKPKISWPQFVRHIVRTSPVTYDSHWLVIRKLLFDLI